MSEPGNIPPLAKILQSKIPGRYKRLFAVLFSFNKLEGQKIFPSNRRIAERLGVTPQVVRRSLSHCHANGWITKVRQGGGRAKEGSFYTGNTNEWEVTEENIGRMQLWQVGEAAAAPARGKTISVPVDDCGALDLSRMTQPALRKLLNAMSVLSGTRVPGCDVTVIVAELVPGYLSKGYPGTDDAGTRVPPNTPGTRVPPNPNVSSELEVKTRSNAFAGGDAPVDAVENSAASSPDLSAGDLRPDTRLHDTLCQLAAKEMHADNENPPRDVIELQVRILATAGTVGFFGPSLTEAVRQVASEVWGQLALRSRLGGER